VICRALLAALLCLASWAISDPAASAQRLDAMAGQQPSIAGESHDTDDSQGRWEASRRASIPLQQSQRKRQLQHAVLPGMWSSGASHRWRDDASTLRSSDPVFPHLNHTPLLI
jgi:hypothetical protein